MHHIHGASYKLASHLFFEGEEGHFQSLWIPWLSWNQVLGFAISILPLFALCHLLLQESLAIRNSPERKTNSQSKATLRIELIFWFFVSLIISFPLIILGDGFNAIGLGRGIQVKDELPMASFGIKSLINVADLGLIKPWMLVFRGLSNPLWFPLALLCCLPILALVLLKRNLLDHRNCATHPKIEYIQLKTDAKIQSRNRLLRALIGVYYFVFLIDLANFGGFLKLGEEYIQSVEYTNSVLIPGHIL
eukprot:TCALIF_02362-PA protein Name:"Protein of unknown function" AED:0.25 eAED:0.66 QI:11/0/0/1/0/0/2/0/247